MQRHRHFLLLLFTALVAGCVAPPPAEQQTPPPTYDPLTQQYWELKAAATIEEFAQYKLTSDSLKQDWVRKFWRSKDPTPTTEQNEFLDEHNRRVAYAKKRYGVNSTGRPWDDRGEIYIRYGEPDEIEFSDEGWYDPGNPKSSRELRDDPIAARIAAARRLSGGETPFGAVFGTIERWYYSRYGLTFQFQEDISTGQIAVTPVVDFRGRVGDPAEFVNSTEIRSEIYRHDYGGDFLPYAINLVRFRAPQKNWQVSLNLGLPLDKLGLAGPDTNEISCLRRIALFDRDWNQIEKDSLLIVKEIDRYRRKGLLLVDQQNFTLTPGYYTVAVEVRDLITQKIGIYKKPFLLPEYASPEVQEISDVELASYIKPAESVTGRYVKNNLIVMPQPSRIFFADQPLTFYYEVYNLRKGPDGKAHFQVRYEIYDSRNKHKILTPIPEAVTSDTTDIYRTGLVDLRTLLPGDYVLAVKVIDEQTQKEKSALANFRILKPRG